MFLLLTFETQNDRETFEYVYSNYKNLMLHKAYGILHDRMLAEDAVSEALLRIYKNISKIDDPASARSAAFVVTIVKNVALTMLKKNSRERVELNEYEYIADEKNIEEQVLSMLTSEDIYALVETLGEDIKGVFLLKYAYSISHREIGKLLRISENNVTVRLHRAKKKLMAAIQEKGLYTV